MTEISILAQEIAVDLLENEIAVSVVNAPALQIAIENPVIEIQLSCYPGFTLPSGGNTGDVLVKTSNVSGQVGWASIADIMQDYFDNLPTYESNEAAIADGYPVNAPYWLPSPDNITGLPAVLRRVYAE